MPHSTFWGGLSALWPAGQGQLHGERRFPWGPHRPVNTMCLSLCTQIYKSLSLLWLGWILPRVWELAQHGQSLGKFMLELQVVRGQPPARLAVTRRCMLCRMALKWLLLVPELLLLLSQPQPGPSLTDRLLRCQVVTGRANIAWYRTHYAGRS